jgi:hypothetical protein
MTPLLLIQYSSSILIWLKAKALCAVC